MTKSIVKILHHAEVYPIRGRHVCLSSTNSMNSTHFFQGLKTIVFYVKYFKLSSH